MLSDRFDIPVPGGVLYLHYAGDVGISPQYWFEYTGRISPELAVQLARTLEGADLHPPTVNGMPVWEFVEQLAAEIGGQGHADQR